MSALLQTTDNSRTGQRNHLFHQGLELIRVRRIGANLYRGEALTLTWGAPAFTTWRDGATLELSDGDRSWTETFPACDAYQLMVETVAKQVAGSLAN